MIEARLLDYIFHERKLIISFFLIRHRIKKINNELNQS